jgi:ABC-type sugar transport system ATPase subunit
MSDAMIVLEGVTRRFDEVPAVDDVSLEIAAGEFFSLLGPSGCGKTTTLRMIAGFEEPDDGRVFLDGEDVTHVSPKKRNVNMVFQDYALFPHMTVAENVGFGLRLKHVARPEIAERTDEMLSIVRLEGLADRRPGELSGGQRQRVALGRAIVREPAVFLMDEPLSNLDAKLRVQTRAEIARLHQRLQTTVVYVTHDQVEAMTMGQRIAVMNEGLLMQVGPPQVLYDTPLNRFVAGFIGSPSMNFIKVTRDGDQVKGEGVTLPVPTRYRSGVEGVSELVAGFRPEHLDLGDVPNAATIRAKADVVEFLGDEELLHVTVEGHEGDIVAVVSSEHRVKPGDVIDLTHSEPFAYITVIRIRTLLLMITMSL